jgi:MFS family permease
MGSNYWQINYDTKYTLNNWIERLGLYCHDSYAIGLFGTAYFFGFTIGCFVFPPLGDIYGRKIFILIGCAS